jgi:sRNA-binding protein
MVETLEHHLSPEALKSAVAEYDQTRSAERYLAALAVGAGRVRREGAG